MAAFNNVNGGWTFTEGSCHVDGDLIKRNVDGTVLNGSIQFTAIEYNSRGYLTCKFIQGYCNYVLQFNFYNEGTFIGSQTVLDRTIYNGAASSPAAEWPRIWFLNMSSTAGVPANLGSMSWSASQSYLETNCAGQQLYGVCFRAYEPFGIRYASDTGDRVYQTRPFVVSNFYDCTRSDYGSYVDFSVNCPEDATNYTVTFIGYGGLEHGESFRFTWGNAGDPTYQLEFCSKAWVKQNGSWNNSARYWYKDPSRGWRKIPIFHKSDAWRRV